MRLRVPKLDGQAAGLEEQLAQPSMAALNFEERVALLIDCEVHARNDRKLVRLLKDAHLKYGLAAIEDIDARAGRGIDRRAVMCLASSDWISAGHSGLVTGQTGAARLAWLLGDLPAIPRLPEQLRIRNLRADTRCPRRPGSVCSWTTPYLMVKALVTGCDNK